MKKIISIAFVLFSLSLSAQQNLDTVVVRNLTVPADALGWFVGKNVSNSDSVWIAAVRRMRNKVQQSPPQSWAANVTVDSLPGVVVVAFYSQVVTANYGEVAVWAETVKSAIASKINIAYWLGYLDAQGPAERIRKRNIGKNVLIDL
jgi:hypothetical protein